MYEVDVCFKDVNGSEVKFKEYCDKEELDLLLKYYKSVNYEVLDEGLYSASKETCFCPECLKMEFIKKKKTIYTCKGCGKKFYIK